MKKNSSRGVLPARRGYASGGEVPQSLVPVANPPIPAPRPRPRPPSSFTYQPKGSFRSPGPITGAESLLEGDDRAAKDNVDFVRAFKWTKALNTTKSDPDLVRKIQALLLHNTNSFAPRGYASGGEVLQRLTPTLTPSSALLLLQRYASGSRVPTQQYGDRNPKGPVPTGRLETPQPDAPPPLEMLSSPEHSDDLKLEQEVLSYAEGGVVTDNASLPQLRPLGPALSLLRLPRAVTGPAPDTGANTYGDWGTFLKMGGYDLVDMGATLMDTYGPKGPTRDAARALSDQNRATVAQMTQELTPAARANLLRDWTDLGPQGALRNPGAYMAILLRNAPQVAGVVGAAGVAAALAPEAAVGAVSTAAGAGMGALLGAGQGTSAAKQIMQERGFSEEDQRTAQQIAGIGSGLVGAVGEGITGKLAAKQVAAALAKGTAERGVKALGKRALKETTTEAIENPAQQVAQNIGQAQVDPNQQIMEGVPEAAIQGAVVGAATMPGVAVGTRALRVGSKVAGLAASPVTTPIKRRIQQYQANKAGNDLAAAIGATDETVLAMKAMSKQSAPVFDPTGSQAVGGKPTTIDTTSPITSSTSVPVAPKAPDRAITPLPPRTMPVTAGQPMPDWAGTQAPPAPPAVPTTSPISPMIPGQQASPFAARLGNLGLAPELTAHMVANESTMRGMLLPAGKDAGAAAISQTYGIEPVVAGGIFDLLANTKPVAQPSPATSVAPGVIPGATPPVAAPAPAAPAGVPPVSVLPTPPVAAQAPQRVPIRAPGAEPVPVRFEPPPVAPARPSPIDIAAKQTETKPTEGQKAAGNYRKGLVKIAGLPDIKVETPAGSWRVQKKAEAAAQGVKPWRVKMAVHYGYFKKTLGFDGDQVDVMIAPGIDPDNPGDAFVIDQVHADTGAPDEHKVVLGAKNEQEARWIYQNAFSDGKGAQRIGNVQQMSIPDTDAWLRSGGARVHTGDAAPAPVTVQGAVAPEPGVPVVSETTTGKRTLKQRAATLAKTRVKPAPAAPAEPTPTPAQVAAEPVPVVKVSKQPQAAKPREQPADTMQKLEKAYTEAHTEVTGHPPTEEQILTNVYEKLVPDKKVWSLEKASKLAADPRLPVNKRSPEQHMWRRVVEKMTDAGWMARGVEQMTPSGKAPPRTGAIEGRSVVQGHRVVRHADGSLTAFDAKDRPGRLLIDANGQWRRMDAKGKPAVWKDELPPELLGAETLKATEKSEVGHELDDDPTLQPVLDAINRGWSKPTELREVMDILRHGHGNKEVRRLAGVIHAALMANPLRRITIRPFTRGEWGDLQKQAPKNGVLEAAFARTPDGRAVIRFSSTNTVIHNVLHEATHAVLTQSSDPKVAREMEELRRLVAEHVNLGAMMHGPTRRSLAYSLSNVDEFVTSAFTDPDFQDRLKKVYPNPKGFFGSAWDWFKRIVGKLLRVPTEAHNAFDLVMQAQPRLMAPNSLDTVFLQEMLPMQEPAEQARAAYAVSFAGIPEARREEFMNQLKAAGTSTRRTMLGSMYFLQIADWFNHVFPNKELIRVRDARAAKEYQSTIWNEKGRKVLQPWVDLEDKPLDRPIPSVRGTAADTQTSIRGLETKSQAVSWAMVASTLYGLEPGVPFDTQHPPGSTSRNAKMRAWPGIEAMAEQLGHVWNAIGPEGRNVYNDVRKYYNDFYDTNINALLTNLVRVYGYTSSPSALRGGLKVPDAHVQEAVDAILNKSKLEGPYFPLRRHGDFVVVANEAHHDEVRELDTLKQELSRMGKSNLKITAASPDLDGTPGFAAWQKKADAGQIVFDPSLPSGSVKGSWGTPTREFFDYEGDAHKALKQYDDAGIQANVSLRSQIDRAHMGDYGRVLDMIRTGLDKRGLPVTGPLMTALTDLMVDLMPETSIRKSELHRQGISGFDYNMMRAFSGHVESASHYIGSVLHGRDVSAAFEGMSNAIQKARSAPTTAAAREAQLKAGVNPITMQLIYDELLSRENSPTTAFGSRTRAVVNRLTNYGYFASLVSASTSLVNATQPWTVSLPWLGAHASRDGAGFAEGMSQAASALTAAMGVIGRRGGRVLLKDTWLGFKGVKQRHLPDSMSSIVDDWIKDVRNSKMAYATETADVIEKLRNAGRIDTTLASLTKQYARVRTSEGVRGKISSVATRIGEWSRVLPHLIETMNRTTTAIAAYQMGRARGMSDEQAYELAHKSVWMTHMDYTPSNKARWLSEAGPLGILSRPLAMFKTYAQGMYYYLTRETFQSFHGATPTERKEAMRALGGLLFTHMLAGGVMGGLMLEPLKLLADIAIMAWNNTAGANDKLDLDTLLRNGAADVLGPELGQMAMKGIPYSLGVDLSTRINLDSLMFNSFDQGKSGPEQFNNFAVQQLGPLATMAANVTRVPAYLRDGEISKALEAVTPRLARDLLKASRYARRGLVDNAGNVFVPPDQLSATDLAVTALGFQPSRSIAERYAVANAERTAQANAQDRRAQLIENYRRAGPEEKASVRNDITDFNVRNPSAKISGMTLLQAVARARRTNVQLALAHSYVAPKKPQFRQAGRFGAM